MIQSIFGNCLTMLNHFQHGVMIAICCFIDTGVPSAVNSLTAIGGHDRQYFNELRARVVSPRIFVRSQSSIAR
jgi:hypothetical protein